MKTLKQSFIVNYMNLCRQFKMLVDGGLVKDFKKPGELDAHIEALRGKKKEKSASVDK